LVLYLDKRGVINSNILSVKRYRYF